jgi:NAD(P)H-flavin reductase
MYEVKENNGDYEVTSIYLPKVATIENKRMVTPLDNLFELKVRGHEFWYSPGQFVELSIPGIGEAPFFMASLPTLDNRIELVIRKLGTLTEALFSLNIGDTIGIRGPYGKPLRLEEMEGKSLLFIAGGLGMVTIRPVLQYVLQKRDQYKHISVLYGCEHPSQRLFVDDLCQWKMRGDIEFYETVDTTDLSQYLELSRMDLAYSGLLNEWKSREWSENIGVITTLFPKLSTVIPEESYAIVVGPPVMYKYVILNLRDLGFSDRQIVVSLERRIRCGVGKCGHCQMNDVYICQDGPLFYFSDINHLREAFE